MPSGGADAWYLLCRPLILFGMLSDLKLDMWGLILKLMLQTKFKSFGNNSRDRN